MYLPFSNLPIFFFKLLVEILFFYSVKKYLR
jgi:hypothetical protein